MKLKIVVDRMQYGVGQGGFHCQQVAIHEDGEAIHIEPYRFVYDCGSDTGPVSPGRLKPLEWAIRHYTGRSRADASKPKMVVNSLYLSHFQKDHIDGAIRLLELADVKEIVIPHVTREQVLHLFAQQVSTGTLRSAGVGVDGYVGVLFRAANGEVPLIGDVPTTRVTSDDENPGDGTPSQPQPPRPSPDRTDEEERQERQQEPDNNWRPEEFSWKEMKPGDYELTHSQGTGTSWNHGTSRLLELRAKDSATGHVFKNLWELRVWSYAQSQALSIAVADELGKLEITPGVLALPKLLGGLADSSEIAWAIMNRAKVQRAYKKALKAHGVNNAHDHNVVSLCLHSGPIATKTRVPRTHRWGGTHPLYAYHWLTAAELSWIGTGDAILADRAAWQEFMQHFTKGHDRVSEWLTVCIPHHGSTKNFNQGLLSGGG